MYKNMWGEEIEPKFVDLYGNEIDAFEVETGLNVLNGEFSLVRMDVDSSACSYNLDGKYSFLKRFIFGYAGSLLLRVGFLWL